jgi:hypothetical protein
LKPSKPFRINIGNGVKLPKDKIMILIFLDVASEEYKSVLSIEIRIRREDLVFTMCEEYKQVN